MEGRPSASHHAAPRPSFAPSIASRKPTFSGPGEGMADERRSIMGGTHSINPCQTDHEHEGARKLRRHPLGDKRKDQYRVHLKMERPEFHNEFLEYNVEIPPRVAVRMEYLMGSTKVNLNDQAYLAKLLVALEREEELEVQKGSHARQAREKTRVKKLVIDGEMPPPLDLQYLYKHPVFRVNTMLRRLAKHDNLLHRVPKPKKKLTPCEPFEHNSNDFFKHLHRFGNTDFVPREIVRAERLKLKGKIQRARARLRAKREALLQIEPSTEVLFHKAAESENTAPSSAVEPGLELEELAGDDSGSESPDDEDATEAHKRRAAQRRLKEAIRLRNERDKEENEMKILFQLRERELKESKMLRQQEADQKAKAKEKEERTLREAQDKKYEQVMKEKAEMRALLDPDLAAILHKLSQTDLIVLEESGSQKYVRQEYQIPKGTNLRAFKVEDSSLMKDFYKESEEVEDLFQFSKEIKLLYEREQKVCEEFLKKINRVQATPSKFK